MANKKHGKSCSICYLIPGKNSKTAETLCYDAVDTIYASCDNLQSVVGICMLFCKISSF